MKAQHYSRQVTILYTITIGAVRYVVMWNKGRLTATSQEEIGDIAAFYGCYVGYLGCKLK